MIILDTTILVYATGSDHPLRAPCRRLLSQVQAGELRASTTVEVIQELAHVRARRTARGEAAAVARSFAVGLGPLVVVDDDDLIAGLTLFRDGEKLGAFDAVLAATARRRGAPIASADRAFRQVPGLGHLDPASPTFDRELALLR